MKGMNERAVFSWLENHLEKDVYSQTTAAQTQNFITSKLVKKRFPFPKPFASITSQIISATSVYQATKNLLPTPTESHYLFNHRDISSVIQGICLSQPETADDPT